MLGAQWNPKVSDGQLSLFAIQDQTEIFTQGAVTQFHQLRFVQINIQTGNSLKTQQDAFQDDERSCV